MTIERKCPMCGETHIIEVTDDVTPYIERYYEGIGYIQDIPLPANVREFIKTGFCMDCQYILFGN